MSQGKAGWPPMGLGFKKLGEHMAVAAEGIDLNRPLDAAQIAALRQALLDSLVLCLRGQKLTAAAYRDAVRIFGPQAMQTRIAARHPEIEEIMILSSEDKDELGDGKRLWSAPIGTATTATSRCHAR